MYKDFWCRSPCVWAKVFNPLFFFFFFKKKTKEQTRLRGNDYGGIILFSHWIRGSWKQQVRSQLPRSKINCKFSFDREKGPPGWPEANSEVRINANIQNRSQAPQQHALFRHRKSPNKKKIGTNIFSEKCMLRDSTCYVTLPLLCHAWALLGSINLGHLCVQTCAVISSSLFVCVCVCVSVCFLPS